jgi:hypothetical protein
MECQEYQNREMMKLMMNHSNCANCLNARVLHPLDLLERARRLATQYHSIASPEFATATFNADGIWGNS